MYLSIIPMMTQINLIALLIGLLSIFSLLALINNFIFRNPPSLKKTFLISSIGLVITGLFNITTILILSPILSLSIGISISGFFWIFIIKSIYLQSWIKSILTATLLSLSLLITIFFITIYLSKILYF